MSATKRLTKELGALTNAALPWLKIDLLNDSLLTWSLTITAPTTSLYSGGDFTVTLTFPLDYPFKPPVVLFVTKIYHPNVRTTTGEICADVINNGWSPTLNAKYVIETLREMMENPNADSPVEEEIAKVLREDKKKFEIEAKKWVGLYASGK